MIKLSIETSMNVLIGTYKSRYGGKGEGIYAATFDLETGFSFKRPSVSATAVNRVFSNHSPYAPSTLYGRSS